MDDTIAAISTPVGEGGIAIIRVSGPAAFDIADRIFRSRAGKPSEFASHTIHFGVIGANGTTVDQVMLSVMRAPRTYTAEDTIEINCHGGLLTARQVLELCFANGAMPAEPGEFTKRAFLNGRLDLTQAEAVMDLIHAKTDRAHAAASRSLEGHLSAKVNRARNELVRVLAHLEAYIDFPDDDIQPATLEIMRRDVAAVLGQLRQLLATAHEGRILRHGISVAIVGRPNVGKSSLMNALLQRDRAIVTSIPGTTRDTIEDYVSIGGIPIRLTDTAGIRRARGIVEEFGIKRSQELLKNCDLVLHVIDASRPFAPDDSEIAAGYGDKPRLIVLNKADLSQVIALPEPLRATDPVTVSATTQIGLDALRTRITALIHSGTTGSQDEDVFINERHHLALQSAINILTETIPIFSIQKPEVVAQQMRIALNHIGEIVGITTTEDILDKVFSTFCIGK